MDVVERLQAAGVIVATSSASPLLEMAGSGSLRLPACSLSEEITVPLSRPSSRTL